MLPLDPPLSTAPRALMLTLEEYENLTLVTAYCLALSSGAGYTELHMTDLRVGGSCHSLGERVDFKHEPIDPAFSQGCIAARLDDLFAAGVVPPPDYIKIDVDGFEPKVIAGAGQLLRGNKVRSLLIEVNQNPFPHIHVRDVFPPAFYQELREHLPPKDVFNSLKKLGRVYGEYPETRLVLPLAETPGAAMPARFSF